MNLFSSVLTYGERFSLCWGLLWPGLATELTAAFILYVMIEVKSEGAELIYAVPFLLFIGPWLVRRMMQSIYPGFRLNTLRDGVSVPMGYTESFKVFWLLNWRTSILMLALLLVISFFLRFLNVQLATLVPSSREAPFLSSAGVSLLTNAASMILMPLVMPGMFSKQYQGFRVQAERVTAEPAPKPKPAKKK